MQQSFLIAQRVFDQLVNQFIEREIVAHTAIDQLLQEGVLFRIELGEGGGQLVAERAAVVDDI